MSAGLVCLEGQSLSLNQLSTEDEMRWLIVEEVLEASVSPRIRELGLSRASNPCCPELP
jgi:hypothetical protein